MIGKYSLVDVIFVPQGAEYQAVCQGLSRGGETIPKVMALPVGPQPVQRFLQQLLRSGDLHPSSSPRVLVMGLCGSLHPGYSIGDAVFYERCVEHANPLRSLLCARPLTTALQKQLPLPIPIVTALTSDRLISSVREKQRLGQRLGVDVVDMEGLEALEVLQSVEAAVAMLRVISDDCDHDLPNLAAAVSPEGTLRSLPLAIGMLRQPVAAARLIRGSLKGLQVLQQLTADLFCTSSRDS
jgi:hypothetical protein